MAPPVRMLDSAAYARVRAAHPSEFVPKSVLFAHVDRDSEIDRGNSFWVKAAVVYDAITGDHVDDLTKPLARDLLLYLAKTCCDHIHPPPPPQGGENPPPPAKEEGADIKPENQGDAKRTQHPDEGSVESKQVIDGIFLVVGFLPRLFKVDKAGKAGKADKALSRDAVDEGFKSRHMQDIVTDVIKLENQLPLKQLLDVVDLVETAIHDAAKCDEFKKIETNLKDYKLGFTRESFDDVVRSFCWYYSPFFSKQVAAAPPPPKDVAAAGQVKNVPAVDAKMDTRTLLDCLHASVVPTAPTEEGAGRGGKTSSIPTARDLSRSGVRIEAEEDGRAVVKFVEATSTLRLPALVYDFKLATVARNLLAREYEEQSKPVTRYFQMMNELVEEVADVRIVRRAGAVRGGSKGAQEVHELIKKIDGYATYPSVFMAMDKEIEKVKDFHDKRMGNFFVRNRPAVIWASSVAAASVVAIVAARKKRG